MAAAAGLEFQRAQSLLSTDREASIGILHSIGELVRPKRGKPAGKSGSRWWKEIDDGPGRVRLEPLLTHCVQLRRKAGAPETVEFGNGKA